MGKLQSKEMIIVCMNTQGVENVSVEMLCLCDIMFQGLQSVSRCIQTEKEKLGAGCGTQCSQRTLQKRI